MSHIYKTAVFLLLCYLCINTKANAATSDHFRSSEVVYQSPPNGDRYVLPHSTVIFRVTKSFLSRNPISSFQINVIGTTSGLHTGIFVISDDGETVIFKPSTPFAFDEDVHISLSINNAEEIKLLDAFSFHTTKLSSVQQQLLLAQLNQQEQREYREFMQNGNSDQISSSKFSLLALPTDFPNLKIITNTTPSPGKFYFGTLNFNPAKPPDTVHTYLMTFQNDGQVHYYKQSTAPTIDYKYQRESNVFSYFFATGTLGAGAYIGKYITTDLDHNILDSFACGNGYPTDGHDFMILPNNHVLIGSYDAQTVDMTKVVTDPNAKTNATVFGTVIQELDQNKNVVFEWKSWDHFKITDHAADIADTSKLIDYSHWNSLKQDADGNILLSSRNMDEITKINRTTGDIMWRLGGKNNQFTITGDTEKVFISHQHDAERIPNGHMTVWDNGNAHKPPYSRAMEFTINETAKTVNKVWQFRHPLNRFTFAAGNAQRLANGNTVIGWGIVQDTILPAVTEVDPNGNIVFEAKLPLLNISYRAFKFDLADKSDVKKINSSLLIPSLSLFPNPASSETTVEVYINNAPATVGAIVMTELFDVLGRKLTSTSSYFDGSVTYSNEINTTALQTGSYYVKVSFGDVVTTKLLQVRQ